MLSTNIVFILFPPDKKQKNSTIYAVTKLSLSKRSDINVTRTGPKLKIEVTITGTESNNNTSINIIVSD